MLIPLLLAVVVVYVFYKWMTSNFDYWTKRGIRQIPPSIFFGNMKGIILNTRSYGETYDELYRSSEGEPAVGLYLMSVPQLLIRNPKLIRDVETSCFSSFHDNGVEKPNDMFLASSPFFNEGDEWKKSRSISTKALTVNKIKQMVDHMKTVCKELKNYVNENKNEVIDVKNLMEMYTTDVTLGCVYGVSANSFKDPKQECRKLISSIFYSPTPLRFFTLMTIAPSLSRMLNLKFFTPEVHIFFEDIVKNAIKHRKENDIERKDLLQQLLNQSGNDGNCVFSMEEILAVSAVFVTDGFETSSLLMSTIINFLGEYPEVQRKLRREIESKVKSIDDFSYELLHSLTYLDAAVKEALRISPPVSVLVKRATEFTTLNCEGKLYDIEKGTKVILPIYPLQKDPTYWPEPEVYRPERFLEEPNPLAYNPFGQGPRMCLGNLFALTQVKACITTLVMNFDIVPVKKNDEPVKFQPGVFILHRKLGRNNAKFSGLE